MFVLNLICLELLKELLESYNSLCETRELRTTIIEWRANMPGSEFCEVYSFFTNNLVYIMSNAKEGSFPHGEEEVVVPDFKLLMKSLEQKFDRLTKCFGKFETGWIK